MYKSRPYASNSVSNLSPPDADKTFYQCRINNRMIECQKLDRYASYKPLENSKLIAIDPWVPSILHSPIIYFKMVPNKIVYK